MQAARLFFSIARRLHLQHILAGLAITYLVCCWLLWKLDPAIGTFANALWFGFILVTTIGFGDYTVTAWPARVVAMILGLYGDFTITMVTGIITSWIYERWQAAKGTSITRFMDQLERLPELSDEELDELDQKIRQS